MVSTAPASSEFIPGFSGHETFVLRSNWLKKAYDLLQQTPDLFFRQDAFVQLGVGKNMAQAIRHWGRVCGVFARANGASVHLATPLGHALLRDDGWDPFLVTPAGRWLLHWQVAARPAAFSWYFTFNLLRRAELTPPQLAALIADELARRSIRPPSAATLARDIDCMLRCYLRPDPEQLAHSAEDALHCPLHELDLLQALPVAQSYTLVVAARPELPDALLALAALAQARALGRPTLAFNELAFGERSPGRVFRLDEDALLARLLQIEEATAGRAAYHDQGGIRQLIWRDLADPRAADALLAAAFVEEGDHA